VARRQDVVSARRCGPEVAAQQAKGRPPVREEKEGRVEGRKEEMMKGIESRGS
jgi:hypothetical protein